MHEDTMWFGANEFEAESAWLLSASSFRFYIS
jgi:hypothetical protein